MERHEIKRVFSHISLGLLLFMAVHQGLAIVLSLLVDLLAPQLTQAGWYLWVLSYAPLYLVAFPIFLLWMRRLPDSPIPEAASAMDLERLLEQPEQPRVTPGKMFLLLLASLGIVYPFNILTTIISALLAELRGEGITNGLAEITMNSNPWINVVFVAIVAPVMEEIVFRGLLYRKTIQFGEKAYVFYSAFVFALFHINVYQIIYAFLLGLVFAYLTCKTGTIRYSITLHILINLVGSGVGPILLHYGQEVLVGLWGLMIIAGMVTGIVLVIVWLATKRKDVTFAPGQMQVQGAGDVLGNPGTVFYMVLVGALVVITLL